MDESRLTIRARLTAEQEEYAKRLSALIFKASEHVKSIEVHLLGDLTIGFRLALQVSESRRYYEYLWINEIDLISNDFPSYLFEDSIDEAKDFLHKYSVEYAESSPPQYERIARKDAELVIETCEIIKEALNKAIEDGHLEKWYVFENIFDYIPVSRDQRFS